MKTWLSLLLLCAGCGDDGTDDLADAGMTGDSFVVRDASRADQGMEDGGPSCVEAECDDLDPCTVDRCVAGACVSAIPDEDCAMAPAIRTSAGQDLTPTRIDLERPTALAYLSSEPGTYSLVDAGECEAVELPVACDTQTIRISNWGFGDEPAPCQALDAPAHPCLESYPIRLDTAITEPETEWVVPVVRVDGVVTDSSGVPQPGVTVRFEADVPWPDGRGSTTGVLNQVVSDGDGSYELVLLASPEADYALTTELPLVDQRPLALTTSRMESVTESRTIDISIPEAPPRCVMSGAVRSSEGIPFEEIRLRYTGTRPDDGSDLYTDPMEAFSPRVGVWHPAGRPDEESPYVLFLCGLHSLQLHSLDWPSCAAASDQLCFNNWSHFSDEAFLEPFEDIDVPVTPVTGSVTDSATALPVGGVAIDLVAGFPPFFSVENHGVSGADGSFELAALRGQSTTITASVDDLAPRDYRSRSVTRDVGDAAVAESFVLDPVDRCPFSPSVRTSAGHDLTMVFIARSTPLYGTDWLFASPAPSEFHRLGDATTTLSSIPLRCSPQTFDGVAADHPQTLLVTSWHEPLACDADGAEDVPCLSSYVLWEDRVVTGSITEDVVVPVHELTGTLSRADGRPLPDVNVSAEASVFDADGAPRGTCSNRTTTAADGTYRIVLHESASAATEYTVTFEPDTSSSLGTETRTVVMDAGRVVDVVVPDP